jgi:minor extracellular serine protease Vpr
MRLIHLRARLSFIVILVLLLSTSAPALADDSIDGGLVSASDNETPSNWFVELTTPSTSDGSSATAAASSKDSFRASAKAKGVKYTERFAYGDLFNGFSVAASDDAIAQMRGLAGVKAIWPVFTESIPSTGPTDGEVLDLATAIQMTGAQDVQETLGFTGRNVKVAVMDTGLDYDHPDLGGCFQPLTETETCRVVRGWDFVGDAYNAAGTAAAQIPHPDPDPDDCNGHGTHVSGIIGANGVIRGVAPDVKFGAYRVFGCDGSTSADIMLAAMERALHDNMDVLNMSIGSAFQWPQYPTAAAADRLVTKKGIVVVASIGNNGPGGSTPNGLYSAGAPGVGANVIGVAAFDNTAIAQSAFRASPDGRLIPYGLASGTLGGPPTSGTQPLQTNASILACPTPLPTGADLGPSPWAPGSLTGKIALIQRGVCGFYLKAIHAQQAGAAGVVLFNNVAGPLNPTVAVVVAGQPQVTIPVVAITQADGNLLVSRMPASITWGTDTVTTASTTGNVISGFSSYGTPPDLSLKPDIGAPGGNIRSTWPLELGGYNNISGTSMASPHVAGAVALYLEANRSQKPPTVRDILQNSASPRRLTTAPTSAFDATHRQGAGMLDILAAIEASALVSPGKLSLGESEAGPATRTLTVNNNGKGTRTFTLSHQSAMATGPSTFLPLSPFVTDKPATVVFSAPTVTVGKNQSATVNVTITANADLEFRALYGGWVVLTDEEGTSYRVPYTGFKGDYQAISVVNNAGLRHVCRNNGATFTLGSGTFTFANASQTPNFCIHFDHPSRSATFTIQNSANEVVGVAFGAEFLARNSGPNGIFAFAWDGTVTNAGVTTTLPNGAYTVTIAVLKALGDASVPAHTETTTLTGTLTIARP